MLFTIVLPMVISEQVQADWGQNDSTKPDYIKGRPFYVGSEPIVAEQTVTTFDAYTEGPFANLSYVDELEEGKTYTVIFDGTSYACPAYYLVWDDGPDERFIVLGNSFHLRSAFPELVQIGNGEPFAIMQYDSSLVVYTASESTHTIKVFPEGGVMVDERYRNALSIQPDWNQGDQTAPDYVKNRPFYIDGSLAEVLLEKQTLVITEEEFFDTLSEEFAPVAGSRYSVVFDGETYDCVAYTIIDDNRIEYIALGDEHLATSELPDADIQGEGNGEPFGILCCDGNTIYTELPGTYTIEILSEGVRGGEVLLEEQTIESVYYEEDEITIAGIPNGFSIEIGSTYTVVFDGTSYSCEAYAIFEDDGRFQFVNYIALGNWDLADPGYPSCEPNGGSGNGEPFCVVGSPDNIYISIVTATPGNHTVKVFTGNGGGNVVFEKAYLDAIVDAHPATTLTATLEDGTTVTYKLFGKAVQS